MHCSLRILAASHDDYLPGTIPPNAIGAGFLILRVAKCVHRLPGVTAVAALARHPRQITGQWANFRRDKLRSDDIDVSMAVAADSLGSSGERIVHRRPT